MTAVWKTTTALISDTAPLAIRPERASDVAARERLLDAAFGESRHARTCQRLRDGHKPAEGLAFTAVLTGSRGRDRAAVACQRRRHSGAGARAAGGRCLLPQTWRRCRIDDARARRRAGSRSWRGDPARRCAVLFTLRLLGAQNRQLSLPGPFERERLLAVERARARLNMPTGLILPTGALAPGARRHRARKILPRMSRAA